MIAKGERASPATEARPRAEWGGRALPERDPPALRFERQLPSARLRRWRLETPGPRYPECAHDAVELSWIERGRVRYRVGARTLDVLEGQAMIVPAGVGHTTEIAPATSAGSMWLSVSLLEEIAEATRARPPGLGPLDSPEVIIRSRALLAGAEAGLDSQLADCAIEGLMLRLLGAARAQSAVDPRIGRAVHEIEARYAEPIEVADLARTARMSRFHFSRVFREATGASPYQFLIHTRVERAARLLAEGTCNVTEAALAVGFTDLGRFGRAFKAQLGRTPSAYLFEHKSPKGRHDAPGGARLGRRLIPSCEDSSSLSR